MLRKAAVFFSILAATNCGGGGGGTTSNNSQPTATPAPTPEPVQHLSGGTASVQDTSADAFSQHSQNLVDTNRIRQFNLGNDFFDNPWIAGSASTSSRDGLGGLFNNNACQDCHIRDGRGHAPNDADGRDFSSILLRAAKTNITSDQRSLMQQSLMANVPDSSVGGQLQQDSVVGVPPEAEARVTYSFETVAFADGATVELRRPIWHMTSLYAGFPFDSDTIFSARVAPPMIGLGLLQIISEQDILANQDINDADGNGVSGKANYVMSANSGTVELGRFGWKAGQPSLIDQAAGAFVNDMGLTSRLQLNENCMPHQTDCLTTDNGNGDSQASYNYEVADTILDAIDFYSRHLAVPERRNAYADNVQRGQVLFESAGCTNCHVESYQTQTDASQPELSNQTIFPFTDLLLHDMGEDLADFDEASQPAADLPFEFLATTREWRTPPLWGIGLAQVVDPNATFLHDGRARTILEAVLWHGGEAEAAKQAVLQFDEQQRQDLLDFLNDL